MVWGTYLVNVNIQKNKDVKLMFFERFFMANPVINYSITFTTY